MNDDKNENQLKTKILIAEDSPTQAERLKYCFEQDGYAVHVATNGAEAIEYLQRHMPHIVVSDVLMPEVDGYQLCKRIKSDPRLNHIPVVLLTTLSEPGDVISGLECGADNFITKPYEDDLLLSRIRYILLNMQLRRKDDSDTGIEIMFSGRKHMISSTRVQILDLLLSTYETAIVKNRELEKSNRQLREANNTIKVLSGLLPICAKCKKIRAENREWQQIEMYIKEHSEADFTHAVCPECAKELYPQYYDKIDFAK